MTYQRTQIIEDIDRILSRLANCQLDWNIRTITAEMCENYEHEFNGEAYISRYCLYATLYREVKARVNKRVDEKIVSGDDVQIELFDETL